MGGFFGSIARYWIADQLEQRWTFVLPIGTLSVNLIGSFLIGIVIALFDRDSINHTLRYFLATGFCGGFTTFSTFSAENITLLKSGNLLDSFGYILLSIFTCLAGTYFGYQLAK
jgi:CrcB protein